MNRAAAESMIKRVFKTYATQPPLPGRKITASQLGKVYELYCLSRFLEELKADGFRLFYRGKPDAAFKGSPGLIDPKKDPHFDVQGQTGGVIGQIWLNIEIMTLGAAINHARDSSRKHELDIILVDPGATGRPHFERILVGIECKSTANFRKPILKEALGVRREMSLLHQAQLSRLSECTNNRNMSVPADPPSEYYVCYVDPKGDNYKQSPGAFGIGFRHWEP